MPFMVNDLPAGSARLNQLATGYLATLVNGQVTYRNGEATDALPGRLLRGAQPAP
jgi:N-acyl-D-aspartate/D-glutamate deacylase